MMKDSDPSVHKELQRLGTTQEGRAVRDSECLHAFWIKRCSMCQTIMESDARVNAVEGESSKLVHSELETLVCSYSLAKRLQRAKVSQKSRLYWVENIEHEVITLRVRDNVTLKGTQVASAYTVQELVDIISRMDHVMKTTELYAEMGRNAQFPDKIARLVLQLAI